ncbi:MAG: hypothetical protein ABI603_00815 [Acidobacteriota bacterium]
MFASVVRESCTKVVRRKYAADIARVADSQERAKAPVAVESDLNGGASVAAVAGSAGVVVLSRSTMPSRLLILSMFGWAAGIVPAILDGTISVNQVMHNIQRVPEHFHLGS